MTARPWQAHVEAELLERYALKQLSDDESATIEEHLLLCPTCQRRLQESDEFLNAIRAELSATRSVEAAGVRSNIRVSLRPSPHRA